MSDEKPSFEETFAALEQTVQQLEAGNLTLDAMLSLYERAMRLAKDCEEILTQAELRVRQVEAVAPADEEPLEFAVEVEMPDEAPF